ncbi:MAG: hypothetical protein IPK26_18985 [Planctomycetes bacterium]|nr:hypothetical protein [Planctomycetota bacterium]
MSPLGKRLLLATVTSAIAGGLAEWLYRGMRQAPRMYFRDTERQPYWPQTATQEQQIAFHSRVQRFVTAPMPRPGVAEWLPGAHLYICYTGPRQHYFDAEGCVEYRFNELGLRDRPGLTWDKPAGTTRVVCLGDSFTLGWGVRQEHNWPVLIERELTRTWPQLQIVNCGGAGMSYADEYHHALEHRFGRLQPDLVLVTLCLNDLLVTNGKLCHFRDEALDADGKPPTVLGSQILADLFGGNRVARALQLDSDRDQVQTLLDLPADHPYYATKAETPDHYWTRGTPQRSLQAIRDWGKAHGSKAAVVVWPLFQGLGDGQTYPFTRMHRLVVEFCQAEGIPCLDLLPTFQGQPAESLWVSPADMHPNERAQDLAAPTLAAFVADVLDLR